MAGGNLPSLSADGNLSRYLQEIRKFPMLEPEQEFMLAKRWQEHEDVSAAHQFGSGHGRFARTLRFARADRAFAAGDCQFVVEYVPRRAARPAPAPRRSSSPIAH